MKKEYIPTEGSESFFEVETVYFENVVKVFWAWLMGRRLKWKVFKITINCGHQEWDEGKCLECGIDMLTIQEV